MATKASSDAPVALRRLEKIEFTVPIRGTTPLIVNRWSEKARQMMLDKQQTSARAKKAPKSPEDLFEASRYRLPDGRDGFPATGLKASIVHAGRLFEGITQVALKQTIIVLGDGNDDRGDALAVIEHEGEPLMREDTPRNANGVADLRYRAQYWPWSMTFKVRTIKGQFDEGSVLALVDAAGVGGIGEWRPTSPKSATGTFGCFEVAA